MRTEADNNDDNDADMREDKVGVEPEQFDISGSPSKEPEEEIVFASRTATPSATPPERPPRPNYCTYRMQTLRWSATHPERPPRPNYCTHGMHPL